MAGPVFTARWDGQCVCGNGFEAGIDELRYDDDGDLCLVGCCIDGDDDWPDLGFEP